MTTRIERCALAGLLTLVLAALTLSAGAASAASLRTPDMRDPLTCLATAIYWEAKGTDSAGMRAVGDVVLNRVERDEFPGDVCGVVTAGGESPPCQFSFWCDGRSDRPVEAEEWQRARRIAKDLLGGRRQDLTDGAVYFHNGSVTPAWSREATPTVTIGDHSFYR